MMTNNSKRTYRMVVGILWSLAITLSLPIISGASYGCTMKNI